VPFLGWEKRKQRDEEMIFKACSSSQYMYMRIKYTTTKKRKEQTTQCWGNKWNSWAKQNRRDFDWQPHSIVTTWFRTSLYTWCSDTTSKRELGTDCLQKTEHRTYKEHHVIGKAKATLRYTWSIILLADQLKWPQHGSESWWPLQIHTWATGQDQKRQQVGAENPVSPCLLWVWNCYV
jgi:hypothetical protein